MPFEIIHILNIQFNGQCDLIFFFRGMEPEFPEKKNMAYKCKILQLLPKV